MLTKLEAVNIMLDAINESPVSSLTSGLPDAEKAERKLDEVSKEVQALGWHCNTDYDYSLAKDASGHILLADTALRVDTVGKDKADNATPRVDTNDSARKLYDIKNQTFVWSKNLNCMVVWYSEFADVPSFTLQSYITYEAAVRFQESEMGSVARDALIVRNRDRAWSSLMDEETEESDDNPLDHAPDLNKWVRRDSPLLR